MSQATTVPWPPSPRSGTLSWHSKSSQEDDAVSLTQPESQRSVRRSPRLAARAASSSVQRYSRLNPRPESRAESISSADSRKPIPLQVSEKAESISSSSDERRSVRNHKKPGQIVKAVKRPRLELYEA